MPSSLRLKPRKKILNNTLCRRPYAAWYCPRPLRHNSATDICVEQLNKRRQAPVARPAAYCAEAFIVSKYESFFLTRIYWANFIKLLILNRYFLLEFTNLLIQISLLQIKHVRLRISAEEAPLCVQRFLW